MKSRIAVLGIDVPGKREGGWGVVNARTSNVLGYGKILFPATLSEHAHYQQLAGLLNRLAATYRITWVALEHPFLYVIAQQVGAVKMWAATSNVRWYMLTASAAKKTVLGDGRLGKGTAAKAVVLAHVRGRIEDGGRAPNPSRFTQHAADGIFYALALAKKLREGVEVPPCA